jgi:hypothetical protein
MPAFVYLPSTPPVIIVAIGEARGAGFHCNAESEGMPAEIVCPGGVFGKTSFQNQFKIFISF